MTHSSPPANRELFLIAMFAIALRVGVFITATWAGPITLAHYTAKGDTTSYMAVAGAMTGERSLASLVDYDRRVFPGYPAIIAVVHLARIPLPIAALCVTWISAGIAAAAAGKVFADVRVAWAMTCLIPHYLINSSLGMSEAPLLAVVCVALVVLRSRQIFFAGLLFGFAMLIRPMGCFALAGAIFMLMEERRWIQSVALCAGAGGIFIAGCVAMQWWTGDALHGMHVYANHPGAYAGHMIAWPFQSLLNARGQSVGRICYIWLHVITALLATMLAAHRVLRPGKTHPRDAISFPWLMLNTAMILCIGPPWGFAHFPRFTIPAAPAMFWTLRRWLPSNRKLWYATALLCAVFAVIGVIDSP